MTPATKKKPVRGSEFCAGGSPKLPSQVVHGATPEAEMQAISPRPGRNGPTSIPTARSQELWCFRSPGEGAARPLGVAGISTVDGPWHHGGLGLGLGIGVRAHEHGGVLGQQLVDGRTEGG
jgi:hypothetical protein